MLITSKLEAKYSGFWLMEYERKWYDMFKKSFKQDVLNAIFITIIFILLIVILKLFIHKKASLFYWIRMLHPQVVSISLKDDFCFSLNKI